MSVVPWNAPAYLPNDGGSSMTMAAARASFSVWPARLPMSPSGSPADLKLPGKRASQHQYGMMSPIMKKAQEDELAARRKRPSKSRRRLSRPLPRIPPGVVRSPGKQGRFPAPLRSRGNGCNWSVGPINWENQHANQIHPHPRVQRNLARTCWQRLPACLHRHSSPRRMPPLILAHLPV